MNYPTNQWWTVLDVMLSDSWFTWLCLWETISVSRMLKDSQFISPTHTLLGESSHLASGEEPWLVSPVTAVVPVPNGLNGGWSSPLTIPGIARKMRKEFPQTPGWSSHGLLQNILQQYIKICFCKFPSFISGNEAVWRWQGHDIRHSFVIELQYTWLHKSYGTPRKLKWNLKTGGV